MGHKVRPTGFRTGIMVDWQSHWYANKQDFAELLVEDQKIRKFVKKRYGGSGISKIRIQRTREKVTVFIHSARASSTHSANPIPLPASPADSGFPASV